MTRTAGTRGWCIGWAAALALAAASGCRGAGGGAAAGGGSEPPAPPGEPPGGGGWLVVSRVGAGEELLEVVAARAVDTAPVLRLGGATVLGAIEGAGIAYGRGLEAAGWAELGLLRPGDARRVVLAAEPGHRYAFVTDATGAAPFLAGGRLIVADATGAGGVILRSLDPDAADPRVLTAAPCAGLADARLRPQGLAFRCGADAVLFSDGVSPARPLVESRGARPVEIAAAGGGTWVLLLDGASRLVTAPADGRGPPARLSPEPVGTDALVALAGSTALVTTAVGPSEHVTSTVRVDASSPRVRRLGAAAPTVAGSPPVAASGRHFLAIYGADATTPSRAVLVPADPADDVAVELPASAGPSSALAVTGFADGTFLVKLEGVGYRAVGAAGEAGPLLEASTADLHLVDSGRWAVFQSPAPPHPMKAVALDRTEFIALAAAGTTTSAPLVSASGRILFLDAAGATWAADLALPRLTLVDARPAESLQLTGGDASREVLAVRHAAGDPATYVLRTDTGTVEEVLPGAVGWFLP